MSEVLVENITVEYPIFHASSRSLKKTIFAISTGGIIGSDAKNKKVVKALDQISFSLKKGDRLALIGHNGAGKTTLLRTLAGIYQPNNGKMKIAGKITPMFDKGVGIDKEATGYENIIARGLFLGLSKKFIEDKVAEIAEFVDLGDFLYMPVHTYSSGMNIRLAFAVSTCFHPEILLLDEWIGAGDANFRQKANERLQQMLEQTSILVLASHSQAIIKKWCNKALWLEHGKVKEFGDLAPVLNHYLESTK